MTSSGRPDATPGSPADADPETIRRDGGAKRPSYLVPILMIVGVLIVGVLVFTLTRAQPNYQEEQFTPDAPEQSG